MSKNRVLRCRLFGRPDFSFGRPATFYLSSQAASPAAQADPGPLEIPRELSPEAVEAEIKKASLQRLSA